jgi:hypothetical protein
MQKENKKQKKKLVVYELIPLTNLEITAPGYYEGSQHSNVSR